MPLISLHIFRCLWFWQSGNHISWIIFLLRTYKHPLLFTCTWTDEKKYVFEKSKKLSFFLLALPAMGLSIRILLLGLAWQHLPSPSFCGPHPCSCLAYPQWKYICEYIKMDICEYIKMDICEYIKMDICEYIKVDICEFSIKNSTNKTTTLY
jgi:hypothetical protein